MVVKNIDGTTVRRVLGGADIDSRIDQALDEFNAANKGGWKITHGSCAKGRVCSIYRSATASSEGYGVLDRSVPGYPDKFTRNSVESALSTMAHEYVHYQTGLAHAEFRIRMAEIAFGRAQESAVNIYRGIPK